MTGQSISHYKILEKLGSGGMGEVWKAEDLKLGRHVALKFLASHLVADPEVHKRFEREARAAAALDHPNICTIHEIDEADGHIFLAMSLLEGESLDKKIARGPLELEEALDIGQQIAKGLEAAHMKGVVHRDIKPENIMVGDQGHVTIMDFGLAQLTNASRLTKADQTMGTVAFMSPEQTEGSGTDHRSDVWSLGVVIYEMVVGRQPFKGDYAKAIMYSILNEAPEPITAQRTGVPMALERTVNKCLAKAPEERYQSAAELSVDLAALDRAVAKPPTTTASPAASRSQVPAAKRETASRFVWPLAFVAAGLLAVTFAVLYFSQAPPEAASPTVRRFSFTPESLYREYSPTRVAISPDGRYIVYVSGDQPTALWVRPIDSEQPRKLAGTEEALWGMFWSPDSRFIGFATRDELKKVSLEGGAAVSVCPLPGLIYDGGSWSPDGEAIVFASGGSPVALHEVPARGGEPELLFEPVPGEYGPGNHHPHFLPTEAGARALLLAVGNRTVADIYLKNLETGELGRLAHGMRPIYSPTGHILYQATLGQGGLWALPFSLETLAATGEAFPVAQGVGDLSLADDGTLVTVDVSGTASGQSLVWHDRQGNILGEIGRPQVRLVHPALSPDGRRVAVQGRDSAADPGDIWVHEVDRAVKQRLSFDAAIERFPVWSPGGEEILFQSERQADGGGFYVRQANGGGEARLLIGSPGVEWTSDWSPDGRHLIYSVRVSGTGYDLWNPQHGTRRCDGRPQAVSGDAVQRVLPAGLARWPLCGLSLR